MARHGGGSRSSGRRSSSSRHRSSSRSGRHSSHLHSPNSYNAVRTGNKPFHGCMNRSYYDRRGRLHKVYTDDSNYLDNVKNKLSLCKIAFGFLTFILVMVLLAYIPESFKFTKKIYGTPIRIGVEDNIDLLTPIEEQEVLALFEKVFEESGMPVVLYTGYIEEASHYSSIEYYAEELYYARGLDETSMVIVFLQDRPDKEFVDFQYDFCCGNETYDCLSDETYNKLLDTFHKYALTGRLSSALVNSFETIMDDFNGKLIIDYYALFIMCMCLGFFLVLYIAIFAAMNSNADIVKYFEENPEKLSNDPVRILAQCPNCGAGNSKGDDTCPYCDSLLLVSDGNTTYVR